MIRVSASTLLVSVFLIVAIAPPSMAQRRFPVPSNEEQARLIDTGHLLHGNQDYDRAIGKYQEALRLNPDNVDALFDLTASYYDKGDLKACLETAQRGAEYESEHLGYFYLMIGTSFDRLKQPQKAVGAYNNGLVLEPDNYLLHYNLGITYLNLKRSDDAAESFKRALLLNPNHVSSHIGLGQIYFQQGYRVPALMALSRAIILEPGSGRAETSIALIDELLRPERAVKVGKKRKDDDEGNFQGVEQALNGDGVPQAGNDVSLALARLNGVIGVLAGLDSITAGSGFAARYYLPYFSELARRGYAEPFTHHVHQVRGDRNVVEWLQGNDVRIREFLAWSREFRWSGGR